MFDKSPGSAVVRLSAEESDAEAARLTWMLAEIEQREREINALQAEQALAVAEYAEGRARLEGSAVWAWDEKPRRICATELADARGVGVHAAHTHLDASLALVTTTPRIFDRFAAGMITLAAARAAVDEIGWVRPEQQPAVDEIVAEEIDQVLPGQVRTMTRTRCMEIDPDSAVRAAAHNRAQRYVQVVPSTMTGMALLTAPLPVEQAVACWEALDHHARAARADGDDRTVSQIMADTLVERVTGQVRCTDVPVEVSLVMTDRTLLGMDDRPATVPGHGPLPALIARTLASGAASWIRRLLTDPIDDTVALMETGRRRFDGDVREFVKRRDQRCRGVGCVGPIRDLEHIDDFALGGTTSVGNGAGLCQRCHHLEDHDSISCEAVGCGDPRAPDEHSPPPGHDVEGFKAREYARPVLLRWHTPINRAFITQAPPALGPGTSTLAQLKARRSRRDAAARSGPVAHRTDQAAPRPRAAVRQTDQVAGRTDHAAVRQTDQVAGRTDHAAVRQTDQVAGRTGQIEVFEPWFSIEYVDTRHAA